MFVWFYVCIHVYDVYQHVFINYFSQQSPFFSPFEKIWIRACLNMEMNPKTDSDYLKNVVGKKQCWIRKKPIPWNIWGVQSMRTLRKEINNRKTIYVRVVIILVNNFKWTKYDSRYTCIMNRIIHRIGFKYLCKTFDK